MNRFGIGVVVAGLVLLLILVFLWWGFGVEPSPDERGTALAENDVDTGVPPQDDDDAPQYGRLPEDYVPPVVEPTPPEPAPSPETPSTEPAVETPAEETPPEAATDGDPHPERPGEHLSQLPTPPPLPTEEDLEAMRAASAPVSALATLKTALDTWRARWGAYDAADSQGWRLDPNSSDWLEHLGISSLPDGLDLRIDELTSDTFRATATLGSTTLGIDQSGTITGDRPERSELETLWREYDRTMSRLRRSEVGTTLTQRNERWQVVLRVLLEGETNLYNDPRPVEWHGLVGSLYAIRAHEGAFTSEGPHGRAFAGDMQQWFEPLTGQPMTGEIQEMVLRQLFISAIDFRLDQLSADTFRLTFSPGLDGMDIWDTATLHVYHDGEMRIENAGQ